MIMKLVMTLLGQLYILDTSKIVHFLFLLSKAEKRGFSPLHDNFTHFPNVGSPMSGNEKVWSCTQNVF